MNRKIARKQGFAYRARCRNCTVETEWFVAKTMTWSEFYGVTKTLHYPQFLEHCQYCHSMAVFDLLAMSGDK